MLDFDHKGFPIKYSYNKFISIVRVKELQNIGKFLQKKGKKMQKIGKENVGKQFVVVPNTNLQEMGLEMFDVLIYAYLKKHYNKVTKDAYPSFQYLAEESGISKPTVMRCVERLEKAGYISIMKIKKVNHYTFSDEKKFEIYSFEFLEDKSISPKEKAYMVCMQQHMRKNSELEVGKVTYSDLDIARMLKIDLRTLRKYETGLQERERPIVTLVPTKKRDPETGLLIQERIFDFEAYNNLVALKFTEVENKLETKASKEELQKEVDRLTKENEKIKKEMWELKKLVMTKEVVEEKPKEIRL